MSIKVPRDVWNIICSMCEKPDVMDDKQWIVIRRCAYNLRNITKVIVVLGDTLEMYFGTQEPVYLHIFDDAYKHVIEYTGLKKVVKLIR